MRKARSEPVLVATVAQVLVALGARYGLELDADQVLQAVLAIQVVVVPLVRSLVTPHAAPAARG